MKEHPFYGGEVKIFVKLPAGTYSISCHPVGCGKELLVIVHSAIQSVRDRVISQYEIVRSDKHYTNYDEAIRDGVELLKDALIKSMKGFK